MQEIEPKDFDFLCELLRDDAGISLTKGKKYLVESRLNQLIESLGIGTIGELIQEVRERKHSPKRSHILEAMTTNETYFFRDKSTYDLLEKTIFPAIIDRNRKTRRLRIWSAACSSGQEPYSLAIMLKSCFPELANWSIEILATDLADKKVLDQARKARYLDHEVRRGLTDSQIYQYFERVGSDWELELSLRRNVTFKKVNLLTVPNHLGVFDLVLCRNVLIYFDKETKCDVLNSVSRHLVDDGFLLIGASELLFGVTKDFRRETGHGDASYYHKSSYQPGSSTLRALA